MLGEEMANVQIVPRQWPIPGTTAILCLLATLAFRVNKIVAQGVPFPRSEH
jgi:hypothetical protein